MISQLLGGFASCIVSSTCAPVGAGVGVMAAVGVGSGAVEGGVGVGSAVGVAFDSANAPCPPVELPSDV